ncbi:hypothetical protein ACFO5R_05435 [Halosolutus amylolyticus]|uniref:Uncharacterized protein n=1 Tax=Halosolutus amylolyticus TaxID=2932267 RepID=A0ABD5PL86_9EURY|nr:hypothetical protein [Halosolutus amylolyticus]
MSGPGFARRRLLGSTASALAIATLAGCSDRSDDSGSIDEDNGTDENDGPDSGDGSESDGTEQGADDLDLREANVVGVEFDAEDGAYAFDVTLHHDDDGEDGYANWWQVERLDGTRLGRRDLLHAHSDQPFTRSETVDIPDDVTCVVVRGHDQTHEYGGRAMLVALETGATRAVDQGSEPRSVDESDCP